MPVFSQASLSRVVCEAAVRFAWLMDRGPAVRNGSSAARWASSSAPRNAIRAYADSPPSASTPASSGRCSPVAPQKRDEVQALVSDAGLAFGYSQNGRARARLELESAQVSVPLKINVSELMAEMLPDSPSWYNIGSSVSHSLTGACETSTAPRPGDPLALTPDVMEVGAAAESAISASGLILETAALGRPSR
jgi:hypothetical protein